MEPNTPTLSNLIFRSKVVSSSKFSSWIPVETPLYSIIGDTGLNVTLNKPSANVSGVFELITV